MIDLLAIYLCPKCGEVLEDVVMEIEEIDTENDEVWTESICPCGRSVTPKTEDGIQCFEKVDHERWLWATGFYDNLIDDEDPDPDSDEWIESLIEFEGELNDGDDQ